MDAYDLSIKMKELWADHTDKGSGVLNKNYKEMKVCVWTSEGYREVKGLIYNESLKFIELELDTE